MSFMEAFKYIGKDDFVLVRKEKEICGIVTLYDIALRHMNLTKPFVLIEKIEKKLRLLLSPCVSKEQIDKVYHETNRKANSLDDLSFHGYVDLLGNQDVWDKLPFKIFDQKLFTNRIDKIREIRNAVVHFHSSGITEDEIRILENTLNVLNEYA